MSAPTSYRYQWNRDGTPIPGATAPTYLLGPADENTEITCTVTAINAAGEVSATAAAVEIAASLSVGSGIGTPTPVSGLTSTALTEDPSTTLANPERGFFYYTETHYTTESTDNSASGYAPLVESDLIDQRITNGYSLCFRYFYLEVYNADGAVISDHYLSLLAADLVTARAAGVKLIVRFAYNNNAAGNFEAPYGSEPSVDTVVGQVGQLMPLLDPNGDVIFAVQAGFIGYWGEWYYTDHFTADPSDPNVLDSTDWSHRTAVLQAVVNGTATAGCFVLVRYVGIKQRIYPDDVTRIGFHNDAFLSSTDDEGTYDTFSAHSIAANQDYLATQTALPLPLGGESNSPDVPDSQWPSADAQLTRYHWTFLNPDYSAVVLGSWGTDVAVAQRQLGYRLVGSAVRAPRATDPGVTIRVEIDIANQGYAAPMANRPLALVLDDGAGHRYNTVLPGLDLRSLAPGRAFTLWANLAVPVTIPAGTYHLGLWLPDANPTITTRVEYAIRLANLGTWDGGGGYNALTTIVVR